MSRPRVTAEAWAYAGTFPAADETEHAAFLTFWAEIDRGAKEFLWRDPEDESVRKWKFAATEPCRTSRVSETNWDFRLSMIRLPSTPWWASLIPPDRLVAPVAAYDLARGLYHNGTAQVGAAAAISGAPGIIAAHGLSDVRLLTGAGVATVLSAVTLTAGWWPPSPPVGLASITVFAPGALS
ncbi:hypothetical protein B6K69_07970 [Fuscovulum blasticum]|nr:hypothetical protein B6K69_07970 [Fuscovulum blasticum]